GQGGPRNNNAARPGARNNQPGQRAGRNNQPGRPGARGNPNWGRAPRALGFQAPAHGWHAHGPGGTFIARNYGGWARDWWSPRWGFWFRYDPETSGYYYYEDTVGAYVQIESISTYHQQLDVPMPDPDSDPDDIPDDDPPAPIEP